MISPSLLSPSDKPPSDIPHDTYPLINPSLRRVLHLTRLAPPLWSAFIWQDKPSSLIRSLLLKRAPPPPLWVVPSLISPMSTWSFHRIHDIYEKWSNYGLAPLFSTFLKRLWETSRILSHLIECRVLTRNQFPSLQWTNFTHKVTRI